MSEKEWLCVKCPYYNVGPICTKCGWVKDEGALAIRQARIDGQKEMRERAAAEALYHREFEDECGGACPENIASAIRALPIEGEQP